MNKVFTSGSLGGLLVSIMSSNSRCAYLVWIMFLGSTIIIFSFFLRSLLASFTMSIIFGFK